MRLARALLVLVVLAWSLTGCALDPAGTYAAPLRVERLSNSDWVLLRPLCYDSPTFGRIIAPKGFVTDFASVPRWLPLAHAATGGTAQPAAVLHDLLYQTHQVERWEADALFYGAMVALGEPWWRRTAMFAAVAVFGGRAYATGPKRYRTKGNIRLLPPFPAECTAA